jgi:cyclopropane fatty-acyl-phospholipid synthase-like methyltransferase
MKDLSGFFHISWRCFPISDRRYILYPMRQLKNRQHTHGDVAAYYDRNTQRFLRFSSGSGALHRKLWPPQVHNATEALQHVNQIILDICKRELAIYEATAEREMRILDVGCGVGESVFHLAEYVDADFTGVTLSPVQVRVARERAAARFLSQRCTFHEVDILDFHPASPFHGAFAVESFSHVGNARTFFEALSRLLRRNGVFVLIDDMKAENREHDPAALRWIERFEKGWHLHGLTTSRHVQTCAKEAGFTLMEDRDLTSFIRVNTAMLLLARPVLYIPLPLYLRDNLRGGHALQHCIKRGFTCYRCMVFKKE